MSLPAVLEREKTILTSCTAMTLNGSMDKQAEPS
jgi:hypothetical protein